MKVDFATNDQIRYVAQNMRQRDFEEFRAISHFDTRQQIAEALVVKYAPLRSVLCASDDQGPIAIGGIVGIRPGTSGGLFYATDRFPAVILPATRWIRRYMFPQLAREGIHRLEVISLAAYPEMHRWLRTLGFEAETGPMKNFGRDGEPFIQFARILDARKARARAR